MPITKVNNVITETAPTNGDRAARTDVHVDSDFALCDERDVLKQIKFDVTSMAAGKTVTFQAGAGSGDVVLTLPTSSATLGSASTGFQFVTTAASSTHTITSGTSVVFIGGDNTGGASTITFPSAPSDGTGITFVVDGSYVSADGITFAAGSGDTLTTAIGGNLGFPLSITLNNAHQFTAFYRASNKKWYRGPQITGFN